MAFVAAAAAGMELLEVIGVGAAVGEAAADVAAAAEAIAMEEAVPLMEATVGRTVTGQATRAFAAYSGAARAGSIARALGASGLVASAVTGAASARSFKKAEDKIGKFLGLGKRKRDGPTPSLLPARPARPALPVFPSLLPMAGKRKTRPKRTTKVVRKPVKRKSTKKAKKTKRVKTKKGPSRSLLSNYETHGLIQRDDVSYFGFQNHGGRDELFRSAMEAVLNSLLRKFRIQKRSPDETLQIAQSVPSVDKFKIFSRRRNYGDGSDDGSQEDTFDLNSVTYSAILNQMRDAIMARVEAGYFPYFLAAYNKDGTSAANEVMRDAKFGDCKLSLGVNIRIKLRNITPNDGNGTDRFALDTNPLQGYVYKFAGDVPTVREGLYETHEGLFSRFHDREATSGILFGPQRFSAGDHDGVPDSAAGIMGSSMVLSCPPRNGKKVWTNCVSSTPIEIAPGGVVEHKMKYSFNGTLINFLMKYYMGTYAVPKIGVTHWLGLQQKFKQKTLAASGAEGGSGHDHVVIEYDLDTRNSGGASFAAAAKAPRQVITREGHNSVA
jgi:hypothetical protein